MKSVVPCAHISVFSRAIFYEEKSRSLHCALFIITTFFFTFQKEEREREREREIDICREYNRYYNKSTRRARAQNNETGNT